jgi:serine/threonine protein kinase
MGYYLSFDQCMFCPTSFYCSGGNIPATPCPSSHFSLPGAVSKYECVKSEFVILTINVPISRPNFVDQTGIWFQTALAIAINQSSDYVSLEIIQAGDDPRTTTVTSKIATSDAKAAAVLTKRLDRTLLNTSFAAKGLGQPLLLFVQVTACIPGYELLAAQICERCPTNYFCLGGSSMRQSCPANSFSMSGSNSSGSCIPVSYVKISFEIPISNFTSEVKSKLQHALAVTAGVALEQVIVENELTQARRAGNALLKVNSKVATDKSASLDALRSRINVDSLNANLVQLDLPKCSGISVTVPESIQSESSTMLPQIVGGSVGCLVIFLGGPYAWYYFSKLIQRRRAWISFLAALKDSKVGQPASSKLFPPVEMEDVKKGFPSLRKQYTADMVLGKGTRSCVLKASKIKNNEHVALKIVIPKKGTFDFEEIQRIRREEELLQLVTIRQCKSAVQVVDGSFLPTQAENSKDLMQQTNYCWFILEALEGVSMTSIVHPTVAADGVLTLPLYLGMPTDSVIPISETACIQMTRDVLAALKVVHSEHWVHCNVTPSNIIHRTTENPYPYQYKLVDFGSALQLDVDGTGLQVATGELAYRAPEMCNVPCRVMFAADIWSLGITMFEVLTGCLPFRNDSTASFVSGKERQVAVNRTEVLKYLEDNQHHSFDKNLRAVILKSIEMDATKR